MSTAVVQIRRASLGDIYPFRSLFVHTLATDFNYFPKAYVNQVKAEHTLLRLVISLFKKQRIILLAKLDGRIIGYMIGSGHANGVGELYWLYVDPLERRQRLGSKLVQQALVELKHQGMHSVRLMTRELEGYYAKYGFEVVGTYMIETFKLTIMQHGLDGDPND